MPLDPPATGGRTLLPRVISNPLYSIGEFSRMCGLPVKTLRFYHEKGILTPAAVEGVTGYSVPTDSNKESSPRSISHVSKALMNTPQIPGIMIECPVKNRFFRRVRGCGRSFPC
ncbi:MAG: hypothetical protein ACI8X5_002751 [Planctomycetota bacterium]|jgi:hypothetical protein